MEIWEIEENISLLKVKLILTISPHLNSSSGDYLMGNEDNERPTEDNLADLIKGASSELASLSQGAKDYLVSLALDGKLDQHQTKGNINGWASELLKKLREGVVQNTAR